MAAGVNTGKYQAGGSGSNYIPDGYIKTVEKLWIDWYDIAFTNTNTTIDIAVIPPNKKIVAIQAEIITSVTQSSGTVSIGFNTDANVDSLMAATTITHNLTRTSIGLGLGNNILVAGTNTYYAMTITGFQLALATNDTRTTISIKLNNWTMTTGTVKTIVRYT